MRRETRKDFNSVILLQNNKMMNSEKGKNNIHDKIESCNSRKTIQFCIARLESKGSRKPVFR